VLLNHIFFLKNGEVWRRYNLMSLFVLSFFQSDLHLLYSRYERVFIVYLCGNWTFSIDTWSVLFLSEITVFSYCSESFIPWDMFTYLMRELHG
jgi:hypothetical protein